MTKDIIIASPDNPLPQIWELLFKKNIHCLPVVEKNKRILGVISEEDLLMKLFPGYETLSDLPADEENELKEKVEEMKKMTAKELMNKRVIFTRKDTHIMRALSRMIVRKVGQLPVLDEKGHVLGMISKGDIFDWIFKKKKKKR